MIHAVVAVFSIVLTLVLIVRLTPRGGAWAVQRAVVWLPGPRRWHLWIAGHQRAAQSARMRLVRRPGITPEVLQAVFVNDTTAEAVRIAVVRRCEQLGGVGSVMPSVVGAWGPTDYAWPLTYAGDAVVVQHALRRCLRLKNRATLRSGYARLAQLAGLEAVWAMELEHVGSVELMDPVVRSSMQADDTDVLLEWLD
ncbi:hypothetical protein ABH935_003730 [Catenulispora sp. GAS73]|uniref:hypothetical protein n=1 Tax=Catenulispora sp. GAS73 TaxID=3156269 RepID=UPI0035184076